MAENPIRQHGKMAVNNTDHNSESNVGEDIMSMSKQDIEQSNWARMKQAGMDPNPRKKSCFVITRVIQKESEHGHEDQDSVDDLDETNTEEVSSDILDISKQTDIDPDPASEDTVQSAAEDLVNSMPSPIPATLSNHIDASPQRVAVQRSDSHIDNAAAPDDKIDNIQSLSRFKVVKIESQQPFRRGRWSCQDFLNPPSSEHLPEQKTEKPVEDVGSGNSSAASSVHYVPGVDDPGKNPLLDGFQSLAPDAQQQQSNLSNSRSMHSPPSNIPSVAPTQQSTGFVDPSSQHALHKETSVAAGYGPGHNGNGNQAPPSTQQQQQAQQGSVPPSSFNQAMAAVSQTQLQQQSKSAAAGTGQQTDYISSGAQSIPAKPHTQQASPAQATTNTQNNPQGVTQPQLQDFQAGQSSAAPLKPAGASQTPDQSKQTDPANEFNQPTATSNVATNAPSSQNVGDGSGGAAVNGGDKGQQGSTGGGGGGGGGALEGADSGGGRQEQQRQDSQRSRESSLSSMKGMGGQALLTPPLLQMVNAMQPQGTKDDESGASQVAIDNKIEQAMDLVKSHLMYAVREEVDVLKEQINELREKNVQLERENTFLRNEANPNTIDKLKAKQFNLQQPQQQQQQQQQSSTS